MARPVKRTESIGPLVMRDGVTTLSCTVGRTLTRFAARLNVFRWTKGRVLIFRVIYNEGRGYTLWARTNKPCSIDFSDRLIDNDSPESFYRELARLIAHAGDSGWVVDYVDTAADKLIPLRRRRSLVKE